MNDHAIPTIRPCPLWRRLLALLYDLLAVVAIVAIVGLLCQLATGGQLFDARYRLQAWWYQPLQGLVIGAYFLASWLRGGQTLGMRAWRLRLLAADGGKPGPRQALQRLLAAAAPLLLLLLNGPFGLQVALWSTAAAWAAWFAPALFDARCRTLPDRLAGTVLIRLK